MLDRDTSSERPGWKGIPGTLFISGAGPVPEMRPRFLESAGGPQARILIVPSTNDIAPDGDKDGYGWPFVPEFREGGLFEVDLDVPDFKDQWNWSVHWCLDAQLTNTAVLYTMHREVADSDAFCDQIDQAVGVVFTGGTPSKVMPTYLHTRAHDAFSRLVERGGSVMGWSAGAQMQGQWSSDTENSPYTEMFGFLPDTSIKTHFLIWNCHAHMSRIVEKRPEVLGIGLDERSAIVVHGDEFEVIGSSYTVIYDYNKVLLPDCKFYIACARRSL